MVARCVRRRLIVRARGHRQESRRRRPTTLPPRGSPPRTLPQIACHIIRDHAEQRIQQQFFDSADLKYAAAEVLSKPIADAVSALVGCITGGGKVLACGNGGSAADAQHFAAEFVGRFERERPGLAAIALTVDTSILTAVGNDYGYEVIFAKQVEALGAPGDILLAMSTSGNSANVLARSPRRAPRT
jgi:phosphoheptose isomerase